MKVEKIKQSDFKESTPKEVRKSVKKLLGEADECIVLGLIHDEDEEVGIQMGCVMNISSAAAGIWIDTMGFVVMELCNKFPEVALPHLAQGVAAAIKGQIAEEMLKVGTPDVFH